MTTLIKEVRYKKHHELDNLTLGAGSGCLGAGLTAQGRRHNLRGQVEKIPQVLDALIGQVPVEVAPGKLLFDVPTGLQRLLKNV